MWLEYLLLAALAAIAVYFVVSYLRNRPEKSVSQKMPAVDPARREIRRVRRAMTDDAHDSSLTKPIEFRPKKPADSG